MNCMGDDSIDETSKVRCRHPQTRGTAVINYWELSELAKVRQKKFLGARLASHRTAIRAGFHKSMH